MKNNYLHSLALQTEWKLKYILPNGIWLPQKGQKDITIFGKLSSKRLKYAQKLVHGFKDQFDSAYLYEVGENGIMIAFYDKQLQSFVLC